MFQKVSERALVARINRVLAREGERLRKCRTDSRSFPTLGNYYIVHLPRNLIVNYSIDDLDDLAEQVGVSARLTS